ncbi:MAG: GIY-YIG nuclease family protein [Bacteroidota bacterium]
MKAAWVYILECADKSYYTGSTVNLEKRIDEHELGFYDGYTAARRPVRLLWSEQYPDLHQACT